MTPCEEFVAAMEELVGDVHSGETPKAAVLRKLAVAFADADCSYPSDCDNNPESELLLLRASHKHDCIPEFLRECGLEVDDER